MRTFIALTLPPRTKELLGQIQEELKSCQLHAKWVNPSNMHITLKFLGEIKEDNLPKIEEIMKKTAGAFIL